MRCRSTTLLVLYVFETLWNHRALVCLKQATAPLVSQALDRAKTSVRYKEEPRPLAILIVSVLNRTRRRVARKHFSSRRKSECELSVKCVIRVQCEVLSRVC